MLDLKIRLQIKINCQIGYHYAKNEEWEGIEIHGLKGHVMPKDWVANIDRFHSGRAM